MAEDRSGGITSFGVSFGTGEVGAGGKAPVDENPFRIVVIAEVVAAAEWSSGRTPPVEPVRIDAPSFDAALAHFAPSLALEVSDPFDPSNPALRVDLVWRDRKSMRPREIVDQVPALRALGEARRVVLDVAAGKLSIDAAREQLTRILPRPLWASALLREVRPAPPPQEARGASAPRATNASGNGHTDGGLNALLDMVDVAAPAAKADPIEQPRDEMSRVVAAVARSARPARAARAIVGSAPQRLERAFQNLLDEILHHPEVHRLEATWRGLKLLVDHCDPRAGVEVDVVNAGKATVADALRRLQDGDPERPPVDLLIVDQHMAPVAADLGLLESWAGLAGTMLAPIVVAGHPTMLGLDSLEQVARSTSSLSTSNDPRAVALRGAASREAARWTAIVVNDALVRGPYTPSTSRQEQPPFEEEASDDSSYVFANGAYVLGAVCAKSHARLRWPTAFTGAHDGVIGNLPVRTVRDRGTEAAIPLEVAPSDDVVRELSHAGLTMLTCAANTDAAVVTRAPVLHRGSGGQAPSSSTLADQLFAGRLARAVQQIAAAIPAETDPRAAEEVARIALAELFDRAAPAGPEIVAKVDAQRKTLSITIRPRRFAGVSLEALTLESALG